MLLGGALAYLRNVPLTIWAFVRNRLTYTLTFTSDSIVWEWFYPWMVDHNHMRMIRSFELVNGVRGSQEHHSYPGIGRFLIWWHKTPIFISHSKELRQANGGGSYDDAYAHTITLSTLIFRRELIDLLLKEMESSYKRYMDKNKKQYVYVQNSTEWSRHSVMKDRGLDKLPMDPALREDMRKDLDKFKASAEWYAEHFIPYRRGYLLQGPPGTGKSTLAYCMASHLKFHYCTLSIGSTGIDDLSIRQILSDLSSPSMVVIEDIDAIFDGRENKSESKLTFSGLLNAIDTLGDEKGHVLVMTTNRPEVLDPALIRAGRIDRKFEIGNITEGFAHEICDYFFGEVSADYKGRFVEWAVGKPVAVVQEACIRCRENPEAIFDIDVNAIEVVSGESSFLTRGSPKTPFARLMRRQSYPFNDDDDD